MTRKPWFWVVHALFFLICLAYTWTHFKGAFPFVELEVKMDRPAALHQAAELAASQGWLPAQYRQAISFETDTATQNYIELEAGGPAALRKVLKDGIFSPYAWRVRHFAQGVTAESQVQFTPDGRPWGFDQKVSEDDPGAALSVTDARALVEKLAAKDWGVDFKPYHLVEHSAETRKSKRVDHSFIYQRDDVQVGAAPYRLRLEVSGDRLTEVTRFLKVPDAFRRRYATLRSANSAIAQIAGSIVVLVYGILICGLGLFRLARAKQLWLGPPMVVAGVIAGLHFLDQINRLPLEWMDYDTALSVQAFVVRHITSAGLSSLFDFLLVLIPLVAGESLSRRAFPSQPQLWRVFSKEAASTRSIFGRVVGAYLFVGFHFAWVVWIYRLGSERLGWWNPSELLFHPDELATYFPWLTSVANSLHAGIWEECLFRAVPLAGAALLGSRYGRRGAWIGAAFVFQALVFGAAHASYPTQPSYARLVELLVPSTVFGGVYLAFGLLPGILMHYTYDVALFAMPLFLSSGWSAWANRIMVIALSLSPLGIVLVGRWRAGRLTELPSRLANQGWQPGVSASSARVVAVVPRPTLAPKWFRAVAVSGIVAAGLWFLVPKAAPDAPGVDLNRDQAIDFAREELGRRGMHPGGEWRALAVAEGSASDRSEEDEFVWRTSGPEVYRELMGNYLEPPHWKVRFVRFEGDLIERAEEWQVFVAKAPSAVRVRHDLPESRPGASLGEAEAKSLAEHEVEKRFGISIRALDAISNNQFQLPARRDWIFTWRDPAQKLKQGEARVSVKISGNEVVGCRKHVHVPEEWLRAERSRKSTLGVVKMVAGTILGAAILWILLLTFQGWIAGGVDHRAFVLAFALTFLGTAVVRLNEFVASLAQFTTAQPYSNQVLKSVLSELLLALLFSSVTALWVGRVRRLEAVSKPQGFAAAGTALGIWLAALGAVAARLSLGAHPLWVSVGAASASYPWLESIQALTTYAGAVAFVVLLFAGLRERVSSRKLRSLFLGLAGFASAAFWAESFGELVVSGAVSGLLLLILDELVWRSAFSILIPLFAAALAMRTIRAAMMDPFPGASEYTAVLIVGLIGVSWLWLRSLRIEDKKERG